MNSLDKACRHVGMTFCFQLRIQVGAGEDSIMKVTCLLGGKFLTEKIVKDQRLVGLLQILLQHNRFLVLDTPKLPQIE